ncbi:MAG TPA: Gfo/Idh/MocA family oxidoreductase [Casimicrobiaceae bacterium]|nr:Gfo/Idh/MocA family oxidoreductase [Casimicrobiaceae bacterium]
MTASPTQPHSPIRLGVVGLGRAFMIMLPTFLADPRIRLVAASDPREEALRQFAIDLGGRVYSSVEALCDDAEVDAVYIASPHEFHAANVRAAASCGKHVVVEKPMAITLRECETMIEAAAQAKVALLVGHSHGYDAPIARTRDLIASQRYGDVRMIHALYYTDFMYRPRRPEELDTARGGGVVFSQGAHQIDIVRLLGGGRVRSVRAQTGRWDPARPSEGAYSALLVFDDGAFASMTYSGYAHFDGDELVGWVGELGFAKDPTQYGRTRAALPARLSPDEETALKNQRTYGNTAARGSIPVGHNHFGMVLASCERADLRPMTHGVMIYDDERAWLDPIAAPTVPRVEVIDELADAMSSGKPPLHSGEWAMATLEVCLAILESARSGAEVRLAHQCAPVLR